jgi:flagella basal body P-ring formation protein FlgA
MKLARKTMCRLIGITLALATASAAPKVFAAIEVKLRERVAPHASVVRLGDVAEIGTADRQQARQLGSLPLMPAPATGTERFLRTREIQDMLSAQGVDVGALRFLGAEQVVISAAEGAGASVSEAIHKRETLIAERAAPRNRHAAILAGAVTEQCQPVPLDEARANEIRQRMTNIVSNYLNVKTGKVQPWKVECDLADDDLGRLNAAVSTPVCAGGSDPWTGRQRFLISFKTADGPVQLPIAAEISPPPVPAVVAIRSVGRGEVVTAADVELRLVDARSKSAGQRVAADSVEKLIGMETRQAIKAGDIVYSDQVQARVLVKRGDVITITSRSGGIRVRTSGRAMHDAAQGELVQVESLGSREKYDARVIGPREAAVYAMSRPTAPEPVKRADTARRPMQSDITQSR